MDLQKINEKEIDLRELAIKIFFFLKRKYWVILLFTICGILLGYLKQNQIKSYSEVSLLANSTLVPSEILVGMINTLQFYISPERESDLSRILKISPDDAKKIKSIRAEKIKDENKNDSLIKQPGYILIHLVVYDDVVLKTLEWALLNYLEGQKFVSEQTSLVKEEQEKMLRIINSQLYALEKNKKEDNPCATDEKKIIEIHEKKINIEKQQKSFAILKYIEDYERITTVNPPKTRIILMNSFLFFVLGCLFSFAIEFWRKVKEFLESNHEVH